MTVKEMIEQLSKFDGNLKVTIHGTDGLENQQEVKWVFCDALLDKNGNTTLEVITLT